MKKALLSLTVLIFAQAARASDFPTGSPKFATHANTVLKAAKDNGKPTVLVFSASWCGPCQEMKKDVYPSAAVKPLHDQFNWAYLDIDDEVNGKLFESQKLETVPYLLFLDASGTTVAKHEGATTPDEMAKMLKSVLRKVGAPKTANR